MRRWLPILTLTAALALLGVSAPAGAGDLVETFAVGSGGRLVIALDFGSVDVVRHDGDEVVIEATTRGVGASSVRFGSRAEGRDVVFASEAEPWVKWLRSEPGVRVRARVPHGVPVRVDASDRVYVSGAGVPAIAP